jgi:hypothetical protein
VPPIPESGIVLETKRAEAIMAIIDQPKPSQPGSPVSEQQPLQPGGTPESKLNSLPSSRVNPQTPEIVKDEIGENEEVRHQ